jgi:hypothetical protein
LTVCDLPGGRCDIDEPEDLLWLLAQQPSGLARYTMTYLQDSGVAARLLSMQRGANNESSNNENPNNDLFNKEKGAAGEAYGTGKQH